MSNKPHRLIWPGLLLIGPFTIAFVYLAHSLGWTLVEREATELVAPWIPAAAAVLFGLRALWQRNLLFLLMTGFAVAAMFRELHYDWTHHGVYYFLVMLMACAWLWRERIKPLARQGNFLPWFKATMAAYFLAVLLARRAFRDMLPYEDDVNTQLEETMENVSHSLLFLTSLATPWPTRRTQTSVTKN